jgi:threonine/homoserine/homoserine lactone efflux protein
VEGIKWVIQNAAVFDCGASAGGRVAMLGIHDLWLFIISGLILNVTPGPDTAYMRWINRALGGMFLYLGARIALLQAR